MKLKIYVFAMKRKRTLDLKGKIKWEGSLKKMRRL